MNRKKPIQSCKPIAKDNVKGIVKTETTELLEPSPEFDIDQLPVEKPKFICSICKKNFSDKNCLKKHIKKIHDVEPEPLLQGSYLQSPFQRMLCKCILLGNINTVKTFLLQMKI